MPRTAVENPPLVSTAVPDPTEEFLNKGKVAPQGAFKTLQDRGIHITSYTQRSGDGRITSSWNDRSNSLDPQHRRAPRPFKEEE